MSGARFCLMCDVSMDLHDGPDTCHLAACRQRALVLWATLPTTPPAVATDRESEEH